MTIRETIATISREISSLYAQGEAETIAREVVCRQLGYSFSQLVVNYDNECNISQLQHIIEELKAARPVQYVTGVAEFCGLDFNVCEGVLIPRPETEELVAQVVKGCKSGDKILDVCTGSGAIAVAVASYRKDVVVEALDISDIALEMARCNAAHNGVDISFYRYDALGDFTSLGKYDIIVSNPPYIPQSDMVRMRANVLDYEPHIALFVDDADALCFYRSIAQNALQMLNCGGRLYFEIYEEYGAAVKELLADMGYYDIEVCQDIFGKQRMVWCRR